MLLSEFISLHAADDVGALALQASRYPEIDMKVALQQIEARQKAVRKLPRWVATEGIMFPVRLSMEQASSEHTALYKRSIIERLIESEADRHSLFDLTGGLGVDFSTLAPLFEHATYVERNAELCQLARHNMPLLQLPNAVILNDETETFIEKMPQATLIYMDPARRSASGGRTYAISDCQPDIQQLLPCIMEHCQWLMVKLSPMLDLTATATALGRYLSELHIVESEGECKELLAVCKSGNREGQITVYCHADHHDIAVPLELCGSQSRRLIDPSQIEAGMYAYLPLKSLCKASCFDWIERQYGVVSVARDSHVFLSTERIDFPGRCFRISTVSSMNKRQLRTVFSSISHANISVRNFPLSADQLRQRLRLADGGDVYIIATTDAEASCRLLVCSKASE